MQPSDLPFSIQPALRAETKELIEEGRRLREKGRALRLELDAQILRLSQWGRAPESSAGFASQTPLDHAEMLARLSKRERIVLKMIARSYSTKQIAGLLQISFKTAESHRTRLMAKLEIHDVAGLTRFAIRAGLVGP